jgi:hypothetical protein
MLTFRVTEEEFERLQAASSASGARCLSDFVRDAVLQEVVQDLGHSHTAGPGATNAHPSLARQLLSFEARVNHLEERMSDLLASGKLEKPAKDRI